jgi:hypothetical protein
MTAARVAAILAANPGHVDALRVAALAGPRGGWIGAGFLRNTVWDTLSGRGAELRSLADLDLVHFDPGGDAAADARCEAALRAARPLPWSVVNQARMAQANGHAAYRSLADALAHWPETATAVAARLAGGRIEILAPHGVDDLLGMVVRATPAHVRDTTVMQARIASKGWAMRWPALRILNP